MYVHLENFSQRPPAVRVRGAFQPKPSCSYNSGQLHVRGCMIKNKILFVKSWTEVVNGPASYGASALRQALPERASLHHPSQIAT
jgi:hypothetical protein